MALSQTRAAVRLDIDPVQPMQTKKTKKIKIGHVENMTALPLCARARGSIDLAAETAASRLDGAPFFTDSLTTCC